jgi:hypothetical protein
MCLLTVVFIPPVTDEPSARGLELTTVIDDVDSDLPVVMNPVASLTFIATHSATLISPSYLHYGKTLTH